MALLKAIRRAGGGPGAAADDDLIEACRQGDRAALESVFTAHAPYLERLLVRIVGPGEDVEDFLQMTFVAAIRAFPRFRGEAQVRTWLSRIAVRTAQEQLRKPERRRRGPLVLVENVPADEEASAVDRRVEAKQQLECLYRHLAAIGPKKRLAFVLHVFEGRPMDEVAALMGASLTATKSRVFWARRNLLDRVRRDPGLRDLVQEPSS